MGHKVACSANSSEGGGHLFAFLFTLAPVTVKCETSDVISTVVGEPKACTDASVAHEASKQCTKKLLFGYMGGGRPPDAIWWLGLEVGSSEGSSDVTSDS